MGAPSKLAGNSRHFGKKVGVSIYIVNPSQTHEVVVDFEPIITENEHFFRHLLCTLDRTDGTKLILAVKKSPAQISRNVPFEEHWGGGGPGKPAGNKPLPERTLVPQ